MYFQRLQKKSYYLQLVITINSPIISITINLEIQKKTLNIIRYKYFIHNRAKLCKRYKLTAGGLGFFAS